MADASKVNKPSGKKNTGAKAKTTAFKEKVEMVNDMLDFLLEHKTEMEYNNIDFNADKVQLYEAIRLRMARNILKQKEVCLGLRELQAKLLVRILRNTKHDAKKIKIRLRKDIHVLRKRLGTLKKVQ